MPGNMCRYYKREKINLECEIVTPMFLGNASGEAQWRAEPFKALLRYWWRVTRRTTVDKDALFKEEAMLFGAAGDDETSKKSPMSISIFSETKAISQPLKKLPEVQHQECENKDPKKDKKVDPLLYLAGMGLMKPDNSIKPGRTYFPPGSSFTLSLCFPTAKQGAENMNKVLALVSAFGAAGGRCRNGWGSFMVKNPPIDPVISEKLLAEMTIDWKKGLGRDYPNTLGHDREGEPLLWKTEPKRSWEEAMAEIAKAYIDVRAHEVKTVKGQEGKLLPGDKNNSMVYERHLLGIPMTNHTYGKGDARHASPLRFVVKRQAVGFRGFVLHTPHGHSQAQRLANGLDQKQVWEKVHRKLDGQAPAIQRATYEEVLA